MHRVSLVAEDDFDEWRVAARRFAAAGIDADFLVWSVGPNRELFGEDARLPARGDEPAFVVPKAFLALAKSVICHSDPERFSLLYRMLLRLLGNGKALEDAADPLVVRLQDMAKSVRRDIHKMHAFVRFREVETEQGPQYVAWFEPEHHIVRATAGFFVRRFTNMRWMILTPEASIHWDGEKLSEGPGTTRDKAPEADPVEAVWKTYYASTFNPARLKIGAMLREMPKKYWKNMPETALVDELIKGARSRELDMVATSASQVGDNLGTTWAAVREEAKGCTRCPLYRDATQTVFGEGPLDARILFVGEQPGDNEDLAGQPFVGPAGQLLDRALIEAGVDRSTTYVTNAVKHFKFEVRGKRRIHAKPEASEIEACRWWLDQELSLVKPPVVVALGATAGRALFKRTITISKMRGAAHRLEALPGSEAWVTVHPSYLLRLPDPERKRAEYALFVDDLKRIGDRAQTLA